MNREMKVSPAGALPSGLSPIRARNSGPEYARSRSPWRAAATSGAYTVLTIAWRRVGLYMPSEPSATT